MPALTEASEAACSTTALLRGAHSPRARVDLVSFIILTGKKRMPGPLSRIIDFVMPDTRARARGEVGRCRRKG